MAEYVQEGSKILASQYNALVDAMYGPVAPAEGIPFTQTKNGTVLNGGHTSYMTKAPGRTPTVLEVQYTAGNLTSGYAAYAGAGTGSGRSDQNRFTGVFINLGEASNLIESIGWAFYGQGTTIAPLFCIIDPTTQGNQLQLVVPTSQSQAMQNPTGKWALCKGDEDAALTFLQVTENQSNRSRVGDIVVVAGNWKKAGSSYGNWPNLPVADLGRILGSLSTYAGTTAARVVRTTTLWKGSTWFQSMMQNIPATSYSIGVQDLVACPDTFPDERPDQSYSKLSTWLSSVNYVPQQQLGFNPINAPLVFGLNNFDKLSSTYNDISSLREADGLDDQQEEKGLSCFDLLIKHKAKHPHDGEEGFGNGVQAKAALEYLSLSSIVLTGDSQVSSLSLSSIQLSATEDQQYIQLYKFEDPTTVEVGEGDEGGYDIVVRDHSSSDGAKINYIPLSGLSSIISGSGEISVNLSVDSEATQLSSIGWQQENVLELYNFSSGTRVEKEDTFDIVVRDNENGKIDYTPLSALGSGYRGPWEITINKTTGDATFTNCVAKVARAYHFFQDQSANVGGGDKMVYFVMDHSASPAVHMYVGNYSNAASILGGTAANCISASITPLYRVVDNEVACDFRYMMNIQAYDNRQFSTTMPY